MLQDTIREILEAPVPFLIGLNQNMLSHDLPLEIMRVNLDNNKVLIGESMPKLPPKLYNQALNRLKNLVTFRPKSKPDPMLQFVDQAFNMAYLDPDEVQEFDHILVRDAMLELITELLRGYEKFIVIFNIS